MIGKRITAHILNKVIIFFPSMILLGGITLLIFPSYFIFGNDPSSGWLIYWFLKYMIFLPTVFLDLISRPSDKHYRFTKGRFPRSQLYFIGSI